MRLNNWIGFLDLIPLEIRSESQLELLHCLGLVQYDDPDFFLKHFICEIKTLNTLQLRVNLFALHAGVVLVNAIKHLLLRHLKPVLMRDLPVHNAFLRVLPLKPLLMPQQLQHLQLIPHAGLLCKQILFKLVIFLLFLI